MTMGNPKGLVGFTLLALLQFFVSLRVHAQAPELSMEYFATERGLYSDNFNDITQDSLGYIWLASQDGLFRYDGYGFRGYHPVEGDSSSLASNIITCLFVDREGTLWVGTARGLHTYQAQQESFIHIPIPNEDLGSDRPPISQIGSDLLGQVLVASENQVFIFRSGGAGFEDLIQLPEGQISCFIAGEGDVLWIGCSDNHGLKKYDLEGKALEIRSPEADLDFLSDLSISDLAMKDGKVLIASLRGGFLVHDPAAEKLLRLPEDSWEENMMAFVYPDSKGNIWTVDYTGLKVRSELGKPEKEFYPVAGDPQSVRRSISGIFEDKQGNYWVYHKSEGLGISKKSKGFNPLDAYAKQFLATRGLNIIRIQEDSEGRLWICLADGNIRVYDWQEWSVKEFMNDPRDSYSLGRGSVMALYPDKEGGMWIGTYLDGLQHYQESSGRFQTFRHDPSDPKTVSGVDIRSIVEDEEGRLWMSVHGKGIDCYDPSTGEFRNYNVENSGLSNDWTFQLLFDGEGGLWAGTAWGLSYLPKGADQFLSYSQEEGMPGSLSSNVITALHTDREGTLWVGTQNGLNRFHYENRSFTNILANTRHSYIAGILSDKDRNLWIANRSGLLRILHKSGKMESFGSNDGLHADGYNTFSFLENSAGEFLFGSNTGLDLFRPGEIQTNTTPPKVLIDQVRILEKNKKKNTAKASVSILGNPSDRITLRPSQFMLTLSYKALNFVNTEENSYMTMLEGLDRDWNDMGQTREISYTNLDPGTYIFRVRGTNEDGVKSSKDALLEIRILPSWYEHWIFRIVLILVLVLSLYLIFAIRTARLRARNVLLDQLVSEKTGALQAKTEELKGKNSELERSNQTKDKLISIIAHDLANPFNSLIGLSGLLSNRIHSLDPDKQKQYTEQIHNSAKSAYSLLQDLLTWARSQTGSIRHTPEPCDPGEIIGEIHEQYQRSLSAKSIRFTSNIQEGLEVWADREMVRTILRNLVGNGIKFVPNGGDIIVSASRQDKMVKIEVRDTGIGMSPEKIKEIQDPSKLESTPGTEGEKGSGLGLAICKEFVLMHGDQLQIESELGKGSCFTFRLPTE